MKVIDAILFTDELDILEIRLNELDAVVDAFVIVEAQEMHGSAKHRKLSLPHEFSKPWLRRFAKKIYYNALPKLEPTYTDGISGWARENFHRNALMAPVLDASTSPDDVIIVSDADEIPRAKAIRAYLREKPPGVCILQLDHYFYNVNCYGGKWMRSSIGSLRSYEAMGGFQAPRGHLGDVIERQVIVLGNAGWHFSSFFDIPRIREKLENFAHAFEVGPLLELSDAELADLIRNRVNIFKGDTLAKRPTRNPTLPAYFLDNLKRFEKFTEEYSCQKISQ
jgi:beta-1,4-mannosyl-glycoprotein beta-1,4-N-acetylglucosaminyltransferase